MSLHIDGPIVYLITSGEAAGPTFETDRRKILDIIRIAVDERVSLVQIREKQLSAKHTFQLAVDGAALTRGSATRLLVNDRADIAVAAKADGVHLTASSLSAAVIRKHFPRELIIGVSTHSLSEIQAAADQGADFAVLGPVFETPGKEKPLGTNRFAEVCEALRPFPILAIGGVDQANVDCVMEAGAAGFAAIRSLNEPASLRSICSRLRNEKSRA